MKSFMIKLLLLSFGSTFINAYSEDATKKDISHIPEAPILPPLNLNGLPYILSIDNANAINEKVTGTSDIKTKDDFGDSKPEIKSFDEMRPRTKTYGLNLKSGEGYSWNDINGGTDIYYKDDKIDNEKHEEYNNGAQENARPNHNIGNEHSRPNDNLNLESDHPIPIDIQNPANHYSKPIDNQNLGNDYSRPIDNQNFGNEYLKPNDYLRPIDNQNSGNGYSRPNDNLNLDNDHIRPIDIQNPANHYSKPIDNQNSGNGYFRPNDNLNLESDHSRPIDIQNPENQYSRPIDTQNRENDYSRPIDNQNFGNGYSKPNDYLRPIDNRFSENDHSKPINNQNLEIDHSRPIGNLNFGNNPPGPIDKPNLSTDNSNNEHSKGDEDANENFWSMPESFERILNDDKFWGWFAEWIEFYYDVVSKYIENNIKEEVAKQLSSKRYYNREDDRNRIDNDANTIKIKILSDERNDRNHEKILINYEDIVKRLVHEFKNALNANNLDENQRDINSMINREENEGPNGKEDTHAYSTHKEDAKNAERKNKDFKLRRVYNEIFGSHHGYKEAIETADKKGVELPIEGNSNRVEKGRPGNYSGGANYEVHGENIYGNSVGNDEVTNIYIFYPNESNDAVKNLIYSYSKNKEHYKRNDETQTYESYNNNKSIDNPKKINENNVNDEKYYRNGQFLKDEKKIKNVDNAEETIDVRSFGDESQQ